MLSQGATQTLDIKYVANNEYAQFQIWDFPGDYDTSSGEFKLSQRDVWRHECVTVGRE